MKSLALRLPLVKNPAFCVSCPIIRAAVAVKVIVVIRWRPGEGRMDGENALQGRVLPSKEADIPALLQEAYDHLKACDVQPSQAVLMDALKIDYEHPEVIYALKCVNWWLERIRNLEDFQDTYDKGGYILSQWKQFFAFLDRIGEPQEPCIYAMRRFAFSLALRFFHDVLGEGINQHDPQLLLQVGQCYKGVGNYDQALKYLQQAWKFRRDDGETLSELADVNALLEDSIKAKVFFREAFFADPEGVDLNSMESEMIIRLKDRVMEMGYSGQELTEWMPIYGCIFGVFTVKRELKPVELGRLKQSIFSLENDIRSRSENSAILAPRLINRYLWLLDHYENAGADPGLIEETMLKIKIIDPKIHERIR
jgi:tetratricopeptide (TPR) repeat protein